MEEITGIEEMPGIGERTEIQKITVIENETEVEARTVDSSIIMAIFQLVSHTRSLSVESSIKRQLFCLCRLTRADLMQSGLLTALEKLLDSDPSCQEVMYLASNMYILWTGWWWCGLGGKGRV